VAALLVPLAAGAGHASSGATNPFCGRLGKSIQASSGAQMFCFHQQPNGTTNQTHTPASSQTTAFSSNADAANPAEDVTPSGVQAYGQSEVSVAAVGPYAVEAWNDATGFFAPCPSPMNKEELTGFGFSADGGNTFVDEGGVPNSNCQADVVFGDPSVEAWRSGGKDYFYITSLFDNLSFSGLSFLELTACQASGTGTSASLSCGQPIVAAVSAECQRFNGVPFCSFEDKEFLSIDPVRGRLYLSYTDFGLTPSSPIFQGEIDLTACDIGTPSGGVGPAGGTAGNPVCETGAPTMPHAVTHTPYFVVQPGQTCENEGSYPAVDPATGDVYVAFEHNWASNFFGPGPCLSDPTTNNVVRVPASCLTLTPVSPCSGPSATTSVPIVSMDAAFVPGYNRFPANDFPRIAVSDPAGTVSIVWNDARSHPLGDIYLQSYSLGSLAAVQSSPVRVNANTGGLHFLPALRKPSPTGSLEVSWFERATANTSLTNVMAAIGVDPTSSSSPSSSVLVTNVASDWNNVSSDIIPNFGDYTDNYVMPTATGARLYVAWSDGRLGDPQPFEAHAGVT